MLGSSRNDGCEPPRASVRSRSSQWVKCDAVAVNERDQQLSTNAAQNIFYECMIHCVLANKQVWL